MLTASSCLFYVDSIWLVWECRKASIRISNTKLHLALGLMSSMLLHDEGGEIVSGLPRSAESRLFWPSGRRVPYRVVCFLLSGSKVSHAKQHFCHVDTVLVEEKRLEYLTIKATYSEPHNWNREALVDYDHLIEF
eukprot:scaffold2557_cov121-Cylindrotheca_fusiformis.AAC.5